MPHAACPEGSPAGAMPGAGASSNGSDTQLLGKDSIMASISLDHMDEDFPVILNFIGISNGCPTAALKDPLSAGIAEPARRILAVAVASKRSLETTLLRSSICGSIAIL